MFRPRLTLPLNDQSPQSSSPLGQFSGPPHKNHLTALLTLSHTPVEDRLYRAMLSEAAAEKLPSVTLSVRRLARLTGINSFTTVRRALVGLNNKLSIESASANNGREGEGAAYRIFQPEEIFERRRAAGLAPYPKEIEACRKSHCFDRAVERIAYNRNLSRREAQVALACAEGITNAEIGQRFFVSEQTVKFHLRNIFIKFGVRRRAELISRLLLQEEVARPSEELKGAGMI